MKALVVGMALSWALLPFPMIHAFFAVEKAVADAVLARPSCRLILVGVQIPIPRDLLGE